MLYQTVFLLIIAQRKRTDQFLQSMRKCAWFSAIPNMTSLHWRLDLLLSTLSIVLLPSKLLSCDLQIKDPHRVTLTLYMVLLCIHVYPDLLFSSFPPAGEVWTQFLQSGANITVHMCMSHSVMQMEEEKPQRHAHPQPAWPPVAPVWWTTAQPWCCQYHSCQQHGTAQWTGKCKGRRRGRGAPAPGCIGRWHSATWATSSMPKKTSSQREARCWFTRHLSCSESSLYIMTLLLWKHELYNLTVCLSDYPCSLISK